MIDDAINELMAGDPKVERRRLPYRHVSRPVAKQERDQAAHAEATWYTRSPIGLACRSGRHAAAAEVVLDVWVGLTLNRRSECPCGKYSLREIF